MTMTIDASSEVQHVLTLIAQSIVDEPSEVRVDAETFRNETVMRLSVSPHDLPTILGIDGNIGDSLRSLLGEMSVKYKQLFALDIRAASAT
jgi:predicted RNA-binding protein YlqC (UPF0109 family)